VANTLPAVCGCLFTLAVYGYVFVAGWDLGLGIIRLLIARPADRDALYDSTVSFWGKAQTWSLLGGLTLLLWLPLIGSVLPNDLQLAVILMTVCLALRATSYGFRQRFSRLRRIWDAIVSTASLGAAFTQGWILAMWVEGSAAPLHPTIWTSAIRGVYPFLGGIAVIGAYGLLGTCWLILKTEGAIQTTAREVSGSALLLSIFMLLALSVLTPFTTPAAAVHWINLAGLVGPAALWGCVAFVGWRLSQSSWGKSATRPLQWAAALLALNFLGVFMIIHSHSPSGLHQIPEAGNTTLQLRLVALGSAVSLLVILVYMTLAHRLFRGKVRQPVCSLSTDCSIASRRTSGAESSLHLS
jgi:cytochrome bd ubiquinol oxidase subunit II